MSTHFLGQEEMLTMKAQMIIQFSVSSSSNYMLAGEDIPKKRQEKYLLNRLFVNVGTLTGHLQMIRLRSACGQLKK